MIRGQKIKATYTNILNGVLIRKVLHHENVRYMFLIALLAIYFVSELCVYRYLNIDVLAIFSMIYVCVCVILVCGRGVCIRARWVYNVHFIAVWMTFL